MVKKINRRKKDLYWHKTAEICISHNFKPAMTAKIVKAIFPQAEVNGRHIGAYKRRLITEGVIDVEEFDNRGKMTSIEMSIVGQSYHPKIHLYILQVLAVLSVV